MRKLSLGFMAMLAVAMATMSCTPQRELFVDVAVDESR